MTKPSSQLYRVKLTEVKTRLQHAIEKGCSKSQSQPLVFFRADDIGIPSLYFHDLITSFRKTRLPLCLATVPAWLTTDRLRELQLITGTSEQQWCWHQHGFVHRNYENTGKKHEFGPTRTSHETLTSLKNGQHRLDTLLGALNQPFFTPPWNRCTTDTIQALQTLNFKAISRSKGATPATPSDFPDFQVNVDLHTRKEQNGDECFDNLLDELEQSLAFGRCGVMIHHQRMNKRAVDFLNILLQSLKEQPAISFVHFGDLLGK